MNEIDPGYRDLAKRMIEDSIEKVIESDSIIDNDNVGYVFGTEFEEYCCLAQLDSFTFQYYIQRYIKSVIFISIYLWFLKRIQRTKQTPEGPGKIRDPIVYMIIKTIKIDQQIIFHFVYNINRSPPVLRL